MSRKTHTVRVEEIPGEPFCFRVESWSEGQEPHRVELLANQGRGECSCKGWSFSVLPALKNGAGFHDRRGFCRHIYVARAFYLCRDLTRRAAADDSGSVR